MYRIQYTSVILLTCLILATGVQATQTMGGPGSLITQTWTSAESPYRISYPCTVMAGEVLTIEPGVDVLFDVDTLFRVEGSIVALGTETDSIRFLPGTAAQWGGLRFVGTDSSTMRFCRVSGSSTLSAEGSENRSGGGVYLGGGAGVPRLNIERSVVSGNECGYNGGGVYSGQSTYLYMDSCVVRNNTAGYYGGGVGHWANNVSQITNTVIENNSALIKGGGVFLYLNAKADIEGCDIIGNTTTATSSYGGGVSFYGNTLNLTRCLITDNVSKLAGGGVYRESSTALSITNCTISGNTTGASGGDGVYTSYGDTPMTNTIVWGNGTSEINQNGGTITAGYCTINDAASDTGTNVYADPLFVDAASGDFSLQAGSPCFNAGDPATVDPDLTRADIGARHIPQNTWWGTINENTTWTKARSPYLIYGAIDVQNCTLTVEAGVQVLFNDSVQFSATGAIKALGTETDSVRFIANTVNHWRGIRLIDGDSSVFHYTRISDGWADGTVNDRHGGAVLVSGTARVGMEDCVLKGNYAAQSGGGICFVDGGGLLRDCQIYNNTAEGGVYQGGGGVAHISGTAQIRLENCDIFDNAAPNQNGGGLVITYYSHTTAYLENCRIYGNTAYNEGGGIHGDTEYTLHLTRCQIYDNYVWGSGGGIAARTSSMGTMYLDNCTVYNNTADVGNGDEIYAYQDYVEIQNSIIWNPNAVDAIFEYFNEEVFATYSNVKTSSQGTVFGGTGNIRALPQFIDSTNFDLGLQDISPCINAGDPTADPDPNGTVVDMGAIPGNQSIISGSLMSGNWTTEFSPYHVTGTPTVSSGDSLIIDGGVQVLFDADVPFVVDGGVRAYGADTETDSIWFKRGTAAEWDGIRLTGIDSSVFHYTSISGGAASGTGNDEYGGGIYIGNEARVGMEYCTIRDNSATQSGGGVCFAESGSGILIGCDIHRNSVAGSVFQGGGGVACTGYSVYSITLKDCDIHENTALEDGGGFAQTYYAYTTAYLEDCRMYDNTAGNEGGGVFGDQGYTTYLTRCLVYNNYAGVNGGGIVARESGASTHLNNCTVYGNSIGTGSGPEIYVYNDYLEVANSIVWNPENVDAIFSEYGSIDVTYSDIRTASGVFTGTGNIRAVPEFADSTNFDFTLQNTSPCVNAGDRTAARDPNGTVVDMGAIPADQSLISGSVAYVSWTADNSPYHIVAPCSVLTTDTLGIFEGVDVLFDANVPFVVEGWLNTYGTETDSVRFLPGTAAEWAGLRFNNASGPELNYTRISGSHATATTGADGGGIYFYSTGADLYHCVISDNSADGMGGALFVGQGESYVSLYNSTIRNNISTGNGGAAYVDDYSGIYFDRCLLVGNSSDATGEVVSTSVEGTFDLLHCTAADNPGDTGFYTTNSYCYIENSIVWNSGTTPVSSVVNVSYSDIQGGFTGTENINADPVFADPSNGDYTLQKTSPCLDIANPSSSTDPDGTAADMGAFPYTQNVVGGYIGTTTWTQAASPYVVIATPCTVGVGEVLTIEPGVEVIFHDANQFRVNGSVVATGTESDSILFHAKDGVQWGGMYISGGDTSRMDYARLTGAYNSFYGGAVMLTGTGTRLGLYNSVIDNNYANYGGGGIYSSVTGGRITAGDCRFSSNSTSATGGGVCVGVGTHAIFNGCEFLDNSADNGAGLAVKDTSRAWLNGCEMAGNTATYNGGAINHTSTNPLVVTESVIDSNHVSSIGGAVYLMNGTATFTECTFDTNTSDYFGGTFYVEDTGTLTLERSLVTRSAAPSGGAVAYVGSPETLNLDHCTFTDNDTELSAGIQLFQATLNVSNSILWNQGTQGEIFDEAGSTINVTYSDVWMSSGTYTGTGNVNVDPIFNDAASGDYTLSCDIDGSNMSPCIDAGDPASPKDPDSTVTDMGANIFTMYGDVTGNRQLTSDDASQILQDVCDLVPDLNGHVADVTVNGVTSAYDAALVLYKVLQPGYLFPAEGGADPEPVERPAANQQRVLTWQQDEAGDWVLTVDNAAGIASVTAKVSVMEDDIASASGGQLIAQHRDGDEITVALVTRPFTEGSAELFRLNGDFSDVPLVTMVEFNEGNIPAGRIIRPFRFALDQNFPNPFNPLTTIRYSLPQQGHVRLAIYNTIGQQVRTLVDTDMEAGAYLVSWDGRDGLGRSVGSGIYLYRLTAAQGVLTRRMVLVK